MFAQDTDNSAGDLQTALETKAVWHKLRVHATLTNSGELPKDSQESRLVFIEQARRQRTYVGARANGEQDHCQHALEVENCDLSK